jgi:hypothetical protein
VLEWCLVDEPQDQAGNGGLDSGRLQASAARDQLWSALRELRPEIERLAAGNLDGSERERQFLVLLARIVAEELRFRSEESRPDRPGPEQPSNL